MKSLKFDSFSTFEEYALRYWEAGMNEKRTLETTADKNSINIDGLSASTNYSIDIQAFTRVGGGPRVEAKFESGITPGLEWKMI